MNYRLKLMDIKFGKNTNLNAKWVNVGIKSTEVCQGCYLFNAYLKRYMRDNNSISGLMQPNKRDFMTDFNVVERLTNRAYAYITATKLVRESDRYPYGVKDVPTLAATKRGRLSNVLKLITQGLLGINKDYELGEDGLNITVLELPIIKYSNLCLKTAIPTYIEIKKGVNPFLMYNTEWFELLDVMFREEYGELKLPVNMADYTYLNPNSNYDLTGDIYRTIEIDKVIAEVRYNESNSVGKVKPKDHDKYNEFDRWHNKALDVSKYRSKNIPLMNYDIVMSHAFKIINEEGIDSSHPIFEYLPFFKSLLSIPKIGMTAKVYAVNYGEICNKFDLYNAAIGSVWELVKEETMYEELVNMPTVEYIDVVENWAYNFKGSITKYALWHSDFNKRKELLSPNYGCPAYII